jgi:hypothetical protein
MQKKNHQGIKVDNFSSRNNRLQSAVRALKETKVEVSQLKNAIKASR